MSGSSATERLSALVGVKPGEWRQAAPALAFAFLCVGASSFSTLSTDTLFVSHFSLGEVSRFYVISAVVRVVMALAYAELARRYPGHRRDAALLAGCAVTMIVSGTLARTDADVTIYAACVVQLLLPPFLPLIAFNAAMSCFDVRQSKRLLPLVAASSTVGTIASAAVVRTAAPLLGTPNLLFLGAALCTASAAFPSILAGRARLAGLADESASPPTNAPPRRGVDTLLDTVRDVRDVPVVRIVVSYAVFGAVITALVDFAFKAALKARFGREEMAVYLGTFGAASNALVLVVQLFFTSRVVARIGVRSALQLVPVSVGLLSPGLWLSPGVTSASAVKLLDTILRFSFGGSVADLLLTPAPADVRTRAKVIIKGMGTPLGGVLAGGLLLSFGKDGPSLGAAAWLLAGTCILAVILTAGARRAYRDALGRAVGEGRVGMDLSPEQAQVLRAELCAVLKRAAAQDDARTADRVLAVMTDRVFSLDDLGPALRSASAAIRLAAVEAAERIARPGDGARLLELVRPDTDDEVELRVLRTARRTGAKVSKKRLDRILDLPVADDGPAVDLWSEALVCLAQDGAARAKTIRRLRREAAARDGQRRAAALRALAELGEQSAEAEVRSALASTHSSVYGEAARAAVRLGLRGAVSTLVGRLQTGANVRATMRALALAGPSAVDELMAVLPKADASTRRGPPPERSADASAGRVLSGTVRAAHVLARLGPEACARVLERFAQLGYRSRTAVARALAAAPSGSDASLDADRVTMAMEIILDDAEALAGGFRALPPGLLRDEVLFRIGETAALLLDLASTIGDRRWIERARAAIARSERKRAHAFELLEHVLPRSVARRTVELLERDLDGDGRSGDAADALRAAFHAAAPDPARSSNRPPPMEQTNGAPSSRPPPSPSKDHPPLDAWLDQCRRFDTGDEDLAEVDRVLLEKVHVLRKTDLFSGLSGEELVPVAEIASASSYPRGEVLFREGEPGDALFVVREGALAVIRSDAKIREVAAGGVAGEMALFDGAPRAATVVTETDAALLRVPREEFDHLLDDHPEIARGMIRVLVGHLRG